MVVFIINYYSNTCILTTTMRLHGLNYKCRIDRYFRTTTIITDHACELEIGLELFYMALG